MYRDVSDRFLSVDGSCDANRGLPNVSSSLLCLAECNRPRILRHDEGDPVGEVGEGVYCCRFRSGEVPSRGICRLLLRLWMLYRSQIRAMRCISRIIQGRLKASAAGLCVRDP